MILILIGLCITASIILMTGSFRMDPQQRAVQARLMAEVAEEADRPRGPLNRALEPLVCMNRRLNLYKRKGMLDETVSAGRVTITAAEFFALKEITAGLGAMGYLALAGLTGFQAPWLLGSVGGGWLLPDLWLNQQRAKRHRTIARDLPEVVDLLALCVDAVADFMGAVQRVVRDYRACPVRDELSVVLQETRIGKRRREAFRSLAARIRMPDVTAFTRAIVHADRMGTGMAQALRIMAEDTRLRRYHAAERFAQKAPLKMLIPLVLIMMTALMMVAGPVLLEFTRGQLFPKL